VPLLNLALKFYGSCHTLFPTDRCAQFIVFRSNHNIGSHCLCDFMHGPGYGIYEGVESVLRFIVFDRTIKIMFFGCLRSPGVRGSCVYASSCIRDRLTRDENKKEKIRKDHASINQSIERQRAGYCSLLSPLCSLDVTGNAN